MHTVNYFADVYWSELIEEDFRKNGLTVTANGNWTKQTFEYKVTDQIARKEKTQNTLCSYSYVKNIGYVLRQVN